ncbi:MAG: penicillin-binding transpeptidase domain-containing protein [Patescibacteria group bacterium]
MLGGLFSRNRRSSKSKEIFPDEILIDSHNLPQFDTHQFEGRLDQPISKTSLIVVGAFFFLALAGFVVRAWYVQIYNGEAYVKRSENNRLRHTPIFAPRGVIQDRNGVELAWNAPREDDSSVLDRKYIDKEGFAHILGYVQYPTKDAYGFYYREDFEGVDGAEKYYDSLLKGTNGLNLVEVDARGKTQAQNIIKPAKAGATVQLTIDSRLQASLHASIKDIAERVGFVGGAAVVMDVNTGEIIALTSYPEFDPYVMSRKNDATMLKAYFSSKASPFLDRVTDGLYTPGSIVKPYMALAALSEKIIDPSKEILSTGSISITNEYDPKLSTVFRDWKAHGYVNMRRALAVSSDVYFYAIGGGYKDQKGLGITNIKKYMQLFGFGEQIGNSFFGKSRGVIPDPQWKAENFNGETWRLGNTYHTVIGQYGFQVTPLQMVRAYAAIANKGKLLDPIILKGEQPKVIRDVELPSQYFTVVHEGMRQAALSGTSVSLNVPFSEIAAKSGTAELGVSKQSVNSWMTGFFPYKNPKYAFAILLEKGSVHNLIGAGAAMRQTLDWMSINTPEYFVTQEANQQSQ